MGLKADLTAEVQRIFSSRWSTRTGLIVPESEDLGLGNDAVKFEEAVVLYADLAESTKLVEDQADFIAAEIYKAYLHCASKIIKHQGGAITAFDGDRVMAIFIGNSKCTNAARTSLMINYAVREIINPAIGSQYPGTEYVLTQSVGIDLSRQFVTRTGVRGSNDLVWVGTAANNAAKLCSIREDGYSSYITPSVYDRLADEAKYGGDPKQEMWERRRWTSRGTDVFRSSWWWRI